MPVILPVTSERNFTPNSAAPLRLRVPVGAEVPGQMLIGVPTVAAAVTVIVTDAVLLPFAFVAVSVYCVVAAGATVLDVTYLTSPKPLLIETEGPPEMLHDNATSCTAGMNKGEDASEVIAGAGETGDDKPRV